MIDIIVDPLMMIQIFFSVAVAEAIFLIYMLIKTPAAKFLKASFLHRSVLIHPKENRYIEFEVAKPMSSLAYIKNRGYYVINPKHVYIEGTSKVPCALVYGNFALNLDLKMAKIAERLKALGISFYEDIVKLGEKLKAEGKGLQFILLGESADLSEAIDYFNTAERADFIEGEIQRRTSAQVIAKLRTPENILKWAIIAMILMIGASIAYVAITSGGGGGIAKTVSEVGQRIIGGVPTNITG